MSPFCSSYQVTFFIAESSSVVLVLNDILGQPRDTLVNQWLGRGLYQYLPDISPLQSGVYFHKLIAGNQVDMKGTVILK